MSTTSLKLPPDLKKRAAKVAKSRGTTTHAFMVEAVQQATDAAELRNRFVRDAMASLEETRRTGMVYDGDEVLAYFKAKAAGRRVKRPKPKIWRT